MSLGMYNLSPDDQTHGLCSNRVREAHTDNSTAFEFTPTVSVSISPADDPFSATHLSAEPMPFDYGMRDTQVPDEMPSGDLYHNSYSQPSQISYPFVDYEGYTPSPVAYSPGLYNGSLNDHGSLFPCPAPTHMDDYPQSMTDTPVFPATPASIPPPPTPAAYNPTTPTKSRKIRKARKSKAKGKGTEKSFPCTVPGCPRVSTCAANLADHLLTHTNIRDYPCEYIYEDGTKCTKSFPRPWGLHRHYGDTHKIDVKVEKKNGIRKGATRNKTPKKEGPYTPPPTVRPPLDGSRSTQISITTRGPTGPFFCCGGEYADDNSFVVHHHLYHGLPRSSFCSCMLCQPDQMDTLMTEHPFPDTNMDIDSPDNNFPIDPRLLMTSASHIHPQDLMSSSPTLRALTMGESPPVYTPTESLPDAKPSMSSADATLPDFVPSGSFETDTDMLAPAYYNMSEQERLDYLDDEWGI
ncbi:hypothetical protein M436DRAFT_78053 [Aureobasidium namibiae CBS 147.97]|uniref:C2H2-type domain-containing protein n=1 Tax=Aureobasidium namibiae CBS 147.97 TaxID=1043004 RepID=A0A074X867_9PEZI